MIEADEYDNMFLGLKPRIEVVTSLEHDHPDMFPTFEDMYTAFESFVDLLPADGSLTPGLSETPDFILPTQTQIISPTKIISPTQTETPPGYPSPPYP